MINYHLVLCPKYRRKIFLIPGVEDRFKELVQQICEQNDFDILAMECQIDHCHLFISVPPTISAAKAVQIIKVGTSHPLMDEFTELSQTVHVWTRNYFASTAGTVPAYVIKRYIEAQKKRG